MSFHLPATTVTVSAVTAYPALAQVIAAEEMGEWLFVHSGAAGVIEYSFDPETDPAKKVTHGSLTLGTDTSSIVETCKDKSVWFRRQTAGAGVATVAVTGARLT